MESVSLEELAREIGTPVYCYSTAILEQNYLSLKNAFQSTSPLICFAVKANSNVAVLRILANLGAGADVVSEGELRKAVRAGIPPAKIVFAGVGKKIHEIKYALELGIGQFNVESEEELEIIAGVAGSLKRRAPVALRVNPDVDANTNSKVTTGTRHTKFGIPASRIRSVYSGICNNPSLTPQGLSVHIGSQLTELDPFRDAFEQIAELVRNLQSAAMPVPNLDLGGGIGVVYRGEQPPDFRHYADMTQDILSDFDCQVILEPGRCLAGNAGILLSEVILRKTQESRSFVVLDAAINDLLRPGLYEAYHQIIPLDAVVASGDRQPVDFVGPVCETSDTFGIDVHAPQLGAGDLVAILTAGAYGAVMASTYNSRPLIPEVLVSGSAFHVVRERGTYDAMLAADVLPPWLSES